MAPTYPITWAGGLFYSLGSANMWMVPFESQNGGTYKRQKLLDKNGLQLVLITCKQLIFSGAVKTSLM